MIESEALIATYPVAAAATALLAGVASSVSPCTVAAVPLVIGYVGGYADGSRRRAFLYAAAFVLGLALAFTGVGLAIALAGAMFLPAGGIWRGVLIVLALVAGSAAVARDQHIRIEYFAEGGSVARRKLLARFGALMVALLFGLMAVLSVRVVWDDYRFGETSPGIGVPQWWYSVWLPLISALIAARAIGLFIRRGRQAPPADHHGDFQA